MGQGRNKHQSRDDRSRIGKFLLQEWDPIGINDVCPADEYQAYADEAYTMLMNDGATADELAAYLLQVATEHMGLSHHPELTQRSKQTANLLVSIRPELKTN